MENAYIIDIAKGEVTMSNGSVKNIDNYILELEDRLIKIHDLLKEYEDVNPWLSYMLRGETLFQIMDILEDRK